MRTPPAPGGVFHNLAPLNNLVCGGLIFFSHYYTHPGETASDTNLFLSGIAVALIAVASLVAHGNVRRNYWSALNIPAGVWVFGSVAVAPPPPHLAWAQFCLGILTVTNALTSLANERRAMRLRSGPDS